MKEIKGLIQGSAEWHAFRAVHVGASDAATISDLSPFKGKIDLWEEMVGLRKPSPPTEEMLKGLELEAVIRKKYQDDTGIEFEPIVAEHDTYSFMSASLDGIDTTRKKAIEIKCTGDSTYDMALLGVVPENYIYQMQYQMFVFELESINYLIAKATSPENYCVITVQRDEKIIRGLISDALKFWDCFESFTSPQFLVRDYEFYDEIPSKVA